MTQKGTNSKLYSLHAGFIPHCFKGSEDLEFSFAILDADHYLPTVDALKWIWPRINSGGLLALDDYYFDLNSLASKAINEFMDTHEDFEVF